MKMPHNTRKLLVSFLLFMVNCLLFATRSAAFGLVPVTYLGIEQGLSNNAVTCIYQDYDGFMWFGTYDGLNRYDGYNFSVFRNKIGDTTSLLDNNIHTIEGDAKHNLWIGNRMGVCVYNPNTNTFSSAYYKAANEAPEKISGYVFAIKANGNNVWVASETHSLIVFDGKNAFGQQIPLLANGVKQYNYEPTAIECDSTSKQVWVFIKGFGLAKYDAKQNALTIVNQTIKNGTCLQLDKTGKLWLGNDDGLYQYSPTANSFSSNYLSEFGRVINIHEDKKNMLWVASDGGGLFTIQINNAAQPIVLANQYNINSNSVYSIFEDRDNRKWVGTLRGGVNIIEAGQNPFTTISVNSKIETAPEKNFILSLCEAPNNSIWLGTDGGGLRNWNRSTNSFVDYGHQAAVSTSISSNFITHILTDFQGQTWFSTWAGGINRYNKSTNSFEHFSCFNPVTKQAEENVWLLYQDVDKTLWASTVNNGTLYKFDRTLNQFILFDASINNIQCLAEDKQGNFWGGNYTSLIKIDKVGKKHEVFKVGFTVRSIHEDKTGAFWVGTDGGGLLNFDRETEQFVRYTTAEGLPNNSILRILEDKHGNLWLSTFNGLSKFNPTKTSFRNFYQSDGLQSNQFAFNAALALKTGEFIFGGIKGFTIFKPDSVKTKDGIPPIYLTGLKINNQVVKNDASYVIQSGLDGIKQIKIPYNEAVLSVDFAALEYSSPNKIDYAYYLEGWDKGWNYTKTRTATYTRLEAGHYTLKIKNTNAEGVWGEVKTVMEIVVLPPWYRTWWAYFFYLMMVASLVYLYVKYKSRQTKLEYEIKLAHIENEKEKQLAENEKQLTERKISFFTHISHEFRAPLTLIISPLKDMLGIDQQNKELLGIYRNAKRMLSLVDQLLLFRKAESVEQHLHITRFDMAAACEEIYLSFKQYSVARSVHFNFIQPQHEVEIYADKEKVEIILFNLLSNAFKFTGQAGIIELELIEKENTVAIHVKDTGSGIAPEVGDRLFESFYQQKSKKSQTKGFGIGLYLSKKLAESHEGTLSYTSEPGHGTNFCLLLKKGKAHFPLNYLYESEPVIAPEASTPNPDNEGSILEELMEEPEIVLTEVEKIDVATVKKNGNLDKLVSELPTMLIVDDDTEIRNYIKSIFIGSFNIFEAADGTDGFILAQKEIPDIILSDVFMKEMNGTEMCTQIKATPTLAHIPIILLTGNSSPDVKLQGILGGAEDHITKPFDKDLLKARVNNLLKNRTSLQHYFYNEITLQKSGLKVSEEYKSFLERCITIVEAHLEDDQFSIKILAKEIGMSHSNLYKRVKSISGQSVNTFIRFIRLRKAAEMFINTNQNVNETAFQVGINDIKYFREQFNKLFGVNPSEYIKKYRKVFNSPYRLNKDLLGDNLPNH